MPKMTKGVVVIYLSPFGKPLRRAHQRFLLEDDAKAIAKLKRYEFGGYYRSGSRPSAPIFFVPDDTLLADEAAELGIDGPADLFGGVVPHPFLKTKAISHQLVDDSARRPEGWSEAFGARLQDSVLYGYTAFNHSDANRAARRMLEHTASIRLKRTICSGGRGQTVVSTAQETDRFLSDLPPDEIVTSGVVLEENLRQTQTLSIGRIELGGLSIAYYGTQWRTTDNEGNAAYGGSNLVCVRGGWQALPALPMSETVRMGVSQARAYDDAMAEYPGFISSRRNYDVGQGFDARGRWRSGVFESSWRAGGASPAELLAIGAFMDDPDVMVVEASHMEEFGEFATAPSDAIIHFQGEDPRAGPIVRYTVLNRTQKRIER